MRLWQQLYGIVWLAFLQIIMLVFGTPTYLVWLHAVIGIAILALAYYNSNTIRKTEAPDRLKRIVRSTFTLAIAQAVLGVIAYLVFVYYSGINVIIQDFILFLHVAIALAMITQASSVATAYDMWEEHEYAPSAKPSTTVSKP